MKVRTVKEKIVEAIIIICSIALIYYLISGLSF